MPLLPSYSIALSIRHVLLILYLCIICRDCVLEDSVVMGADYYEGERRPHASRALGAAYPPLGIGQGTVVRSVNACTQR